MNELKSALSPQQINALKKAAEVGWRVGLGGIELALLASCATKPGQEAPAAPDVNPEENEGDPISPEAIVTQVPTQVESEGFSPEVVQLRRGDVELEAAFTEEYGREGKAYIFETSKLSTGATREDMKLIIAPVIASENGEMVSGSDVFIFLGGEWTQLPLTENILDQELTGEELTEWQAYIERSSISGVGEFDVTQLNRVIVTAINNPNNYAMVAERVFVAETDDGLQGVHEFLVVDHDGKLHPVRFDSQFEEIAALEVMTDGGPMMFLKNSAESTAVVLPVELFDQIKDQNPVVAAGGEQIINAETGEVLLEKKDGEWTEVVRMIFEDAVITMEEHEKLGPVQVVRFTATTKIENPETGEIEPGKTYHFEIISNFDPEVLRIESLDAEAFMAYLQQVPGFEGDKFELNVEEGKPVVIYFLDMNAVDAEGNNLTSAFTQNMRGGSGVVYEIPGREDVRAWDHFGRSSVRAPYVVVYNLSIQKDLNDPDRLQSIIAGAAMGQIVSALFTGELGLGEDRGLIVDGQAVTSERDVANLEKNKSGAINPYFVIPLYMDVFPVGILEIKLGD